MSETGSKIASVEAALLRLPLRQPITFPSGTWSSWSYVVTRVRTVDGNEAAAYGFLGEIPVDLMITELIGPALVGLDTIDLRSVAERGARAAGPPLADVVRPAASLVEVCLWDLAARASGVPLWQLLAPQPARREVPVMFVEHRRPDDTPDTFAERVADLAGSGVRAVKIKHYGDAAETAARLAAIRTVAPESLDLVVDVAWVWPELESALNEARAWEEYRLAWIEDPFPPDRVEEAARLRAAIATPLAIGDLVTSLDLAERLIRQEAVDLLRVDVTTMGGVAGVERLATLAGSAGVELSPELFAEVHQHLAFAWPQVRGIEIYSPESGVWSADAFVRPSTPTFDSLGRVIAPTSPGSGLEVDWDFVERTATRYSRYPAE